MVNKTDLPQKIDMEKVRELANRATIVTTSLLEKKESIELEEAIAALFFEGQIESADLTYVSNTRHISLVTSSIGSNNQ